MLDYPSVEVDDRPREGRAERCEGRGRGKRAGHGDVVSTRFTNLNYWVDVKTGFDYLVQVQVPPLRMEKPEDIEILPLESVNPLVNLMVRDVATVHRGVRPGEFDRDMSQRYVTLTANVEGEDMGRASRQVAAAVGVRRAPPRGVRVDLMGQLPPMNEMFQALGIGLAVAVFVILVLLTAYFQSPRLALVSVGAVPGVLAGIATILFLTGTSLNIESFMGSIMCLGVSVSNSVMLVTFMDDHWKTAIRRFEAAVIGASERLRPILDDCLRDDRRHGANGLGAGEGEPDAGAAGAGRDRRAGDVDLCHVVGLALVLRDGHWPPGGAFALDVSR